MVSSRNQRIRSTRRTRSLVSSGVIDKPELVAEDVTVPRVVKRAAWTRDEVGQVRRDSIAKDFSKVLASMSRHLCRGWAIRHSIDETVTSAHPHNLARGNGVWRSRHGEPCGWPSLYLIRELGNPGSLLLETAPAECSRPAAPCGVSPTLPHD
jgi:hypothetical protein